LFNILDSKILPVAKTNIEARWKLHARIFHQRNCKKNGGKKINV